MQLTGPAKRGIVRHAPPDCGAETDGSTMRLMNPGLNIRILFEEWIERIRTAHTRLTMRRVHFAFVDDDFGGEVWYWEDHRGDWWLAVDRFGLRKRWHEPKLDTDGNVSYVDFKSLERFESQD